MAKTVVFGHKNPDTDTITSALVYAYLKQQLGEDVEAVRLGELNNETKFALEKFGFEAPRLIGNVKDEAEKAKNYTEMIGWNLSLSRRKEQRIENIETNMQAIKRTQSQQKRKQKFEKKARKSRVSWYQDK